MRFAHATTWWLVGPGGLSKEEEKDMFEDFQSAMAITKKMESILKDLDYLENQEWFKN